MSLGLLRPQRQAFGIGIKVWLIKRQPYPPGAGTIVLSINRLLHYFAPIAHCPLLLRVSSKCRLGHM